MKEIWDDLMTAVIDQSVTREEIIFAWWNTSLAPSAKSRSAPDTLLIAVSVLQHLAEIKSADFIALGEVSEADLKYFADSSLLTDYKFVSAVTAVGKSNFDIGFLYNPGKLAVLNSVPITTTSGRRTLKIAQRVTLLVLDCQTIVHVFISHWPSRMYTSANDSTRHELGLRLRTKVEEILENGKADPLVILLGDFNDEPFDLSLSEQLKASRDIALVRRKEHLLYNPFWSLLGRLHSEKQSAGSYFHKSGEITKWLTFDQIIFSHGFISANKWELKTDCEHIIHIPELLALVKNRNSKFDHLPVFGIIERVASHV